MHQNWPLTEKKQESQLLDNLIKIAEIVFGLFYKAFTCGVRRKDIPKLDLGLFAFSIIGFSYIINLRLDRFLAQSWMECQTRFCKNFFYDLCLVGFYNYFFALIVINFVIFFVVLGFKEACFSIRIQRALDEIGLKTKKNSTPKVVNIKKENAHKTSVTVFSKGIGLPQYESKKADISSAIGQRIEKLSEHSDCSKVILTLCDKPLTDFCEFQSYKHLLKKPMSFVIGESRDGLIVENMRSLPHLICSGSTGGGKSVFYNSVLISLLNSTPNLKLFLLDLKMGVEAAPYKGLKNVEIAKNEAQAIKLLKKVVGEMKARLQLMESKEVKSLSKLNVKADPILVAIDEASVLYGEESHDSTKKALVAEARSLTDTIAKLSRSSGIHLLLCTQKVRKDTIDTKVQENLEGKMCFKQATVPGSVNILGNRMGADLPPIKGRGIWSKGSSFHEVQTPFLSDEQLKEEINDLTMKFNNQESNMIYKEKAEKKAKYRSEELKKGNEDAQKQD